MASKGELKMYVARDLEAACMGCVTDYVHANASDVAYILRGEVVRLPSLDLFLETVKSGDVRTFSCDYHVPKSIEARVLP